MAEEEDAAARKTEEEAVQQLYWVQFSPTTLHIVTFAHGRFRVLLRGIEFSFQFGFGASTP